MKKNIIYTLLLITILSASCKSDFADINTDPEKTDSDFSYLFTAGLEKMNLHHYYPWFWNYRTAMAWTQAVAVETGNTDKVSNMTEMYELFNDMVKVKVQSEAIKYKKKALPADEAVVYQHLEAMCTPMVIYMSLLATDGTGSIPYTEAGKAYFEGESAFRPKFDSQKELSEQWLKELKSAIEVLNNPVIGSDGNPVPQLIIGKQDFVYGGDAKKWAKFANSLRLKIVVRLLHQDRALAVSTLQDILQYPLIETPSDDFIWNPGSQWHNTRNELNLPHGGIQAIDFMVKNKDPRVRFIYKKNEYDENIINGFLQAGKKLPSYIDQYVEKQTDANGKEKFAGWKAPGEPWVRYHGVPIDTKSKEYSSLMEDYYLSENFEMGTGDQRKSYFPTSALNETMLKGSYKFVYPSLPGVGPKVDERENAIYFNYMSAAEVNLYLAELKVLEPAIVPGDAATYYKNGIDYSVRMYDNLAKLNRIPYYLETTGLPTDATIELKNNEISDLLSQADYQLTGSKQDQLERIYIQQYLHFIMYPQDLFTTVRRSGVPMKDSRYYPLLTWNSKNTADVPMPRRFMIKSLSQSDELYNSRQAALTEQGLTPGSIDAETLSRERLWFDIGAPNYGAGPNY